MREQETHGEAKAFVRKWCAKVGITRARLAELISDRVETEVFEGDVNNWFRDGRRFGSKDKKEGLEREIQLAVLEILIERNGEKQISAELALNYLASLGTPFTDIQKVAALFPTDEFRAAFAAYSPVPEKTFPNAPRQFVTYERLIGRSHELSTTLEKLLSADPTSPVAIVGMGGIGKSAILSEVVTRCQKMRVFDGIVTLSAEVDPHDKTNVFTLEKVLRSIGEQLSFVNFVRQSISEKLERLRRALLEVNLLIVLDNLETATTPQNQLIAHLQPILGKSRLLLASRHRIAGEVFTLALTGLEGKMGRDFLRMEANARGVAYISESDHTILDRVVQSTGGSPLAMKLVVAQMSGFPPETVLTHLEKVQPLRADSDENDTIQFYKHIFIRSWLLLNRTSCFLLVDMATLRSGSTQTFEQLQKISRMESAEFVPALDALLCYSFVELKDTVELQSRRYYLHPLTRYFVRSDIIQLDE